MKMNEEKINQLIHIYKENKRLFEKGDSLIQDFKNCYAPIQNPLLLMINQIKTEEDKKNLEGVLLDKVSYGEIAETDSKMLSFYLTREFPNKPTKEEAINHVKNNFTLFKKKLDEYEQELIKYINQEI